MTFPVGSGLGWDGIHPRALNRLDDALMALLIDLLMICEMLGKWPMAIQLVIVVLLPKNDGGGAPSDFCQCCPASGCVYDGLSSCSGSGSKPGRTCMLGRRRG